ncbi:MAG: DUF3175 domain-containing protein [Candidatus Eremiobacteraeota bacterium]|nr:DUF3175 domain-containing protein [Candidatus Eremiobacteraeota bacterium]
MAKRWSGEVAAHSDALDLEEGVFKKRSAHEIALSLKRSAVRSRRRKGRTAYQSAMSMLNFYINRGGKNLSEGRLRILERAKSELREVFGRPPKSASHKRKGNIPAMKRATWKPHEKHGDLTKRSDLPDSVFAYPKERKEPMTDAKHVRNAVARFDQVEGVPDDERELAFANIKKAAKHYKVDLSEADWKELGKRPSTGRTTADRKASAKQAASTRKKKSSAKSSTRKKSSTHKKTSTRKKASR